jgi:hypothetical protein
MVRFFVASKGDVFLSIDNVVGYEIEQQDRSAGVRSNHLLDQGLAIRALTRGGRHWMARLLLKVGHERDDDRRGRRQFRRAFS